MLGLAKERVGDSVRVTFLHNDALTMPLPGVAHDVILTHFFLDCFDDQSASCLIERISRTVSPGARWIISEFRAEQWWSRSLVSLLYLFFHISTGLKTRRLPDYPRWLTQSGFVRQQRETSAGCLLVSEIWERTPQVSL